MKLEHSDCIKTKLVNLLFPVKYIWKLVDQVFHLINLIIFWAVPRKHRIEMNLDRTKKSPNPHKLTVNKMFLVSKIYLI